MQDISGDFHTDTDQKLFDFSALDRQIGHIIAINVNKQGKKQQ